MKNGSNVPAASYKANNTTVFVLAVIFSVFLFAGAFVYNEDVRALAASAFTSFQSLKNNDAAVDAFVEKLPKEAQQDQLTAIIKEAPQKPNANIREEDQDPQVLLRASETADEDVSTSSSSSSHEKDMNVEDLRECDLFTGKWVLDNESHPLYKEEECELLTSQVTCIKNGRQDTLYQKWRWQPRDCSLPK